MKETVKTGRRTFRDLVPPVDLTDRIERSTRADRPIRLLAKAVRRRIGPGGLRDLLHGVPLGKPLHPPLANVSLGFWVATAVLDVTRSDPRAARILLAGGVAGAIPAAVAGITDWSVLHREQQRVGFVHAIANLVALGLYAGSLAFRLAGHDRNGRMLSFAGLGAAGMGGYLGGHLAYRQAAGANHAESVTHLVPLGWHDLCDITDLPDGRPVARRLGYIDLFVLRDRQRGHRARRRLLPPGRTPPSGETGLRGGHLLRGVPLARKHLPVVRRSRRPRPRHGPTAVLRDPDPPRRRPPGPSRPGLTWA